MEFTVFGYHIKDIIHSYTDFTKNFILGEHICTGGQSSVYATSRNIDGYKNLFYLVTKVIDISTDELREENLLKAVQEYILMRKLNTIHYSGISYSKNKSHILLTMEMMEYSLTDAVEFDIDSEVHDLKCVGSDYGLKYLILEVTSFLHRLHSVGFVHLDITPGNVMFRNGRNETSLFSGNGFKVIDLGLSEQIGFDRLCIKLDCFVGTKGYSSPELYSANRNISYATDIWSLAAVILYALNGYNIFDTCTSYFQRNSYNDFVDSHLMELYLINKINFKLYDLLCQMLEFDPNKRPKARDILKHPYFEGRVFEGSDNELYCSRNKYRIVTKTNTNRTMKHLFVPLTGKVNVKKYKQ